MHNSVRPKVRNECVLSILLERDGGSVPQQTREAKPRLLGPDRKRATTQWGGEKGKGGSRPGLTHVGPPLLLGPRE